MNFPYRVVETLSPESGGLTVVLRPIIPIRVGGPQGMEEFQALVDSGSDACMFPQSFAEMFGVVTAPGRGPHTEALGGQKLPASFGNVELELRQGTEAVRWCARVQFFEFSTAEDEAFILGHEGFLDYFTATFDGESAMLTVTPNSDLLVATNRSGN